MSLRLPSAAAASLLAAMMVAGPAQADCRTEYQTRLNECATANPYRDGRRLGEADFSYIDECRRKIRPLYEHCLGSGSAPIGECNFEEARKNIDWVMEVDPPAYRTFHGYRDRGYAPLEAVIEAQGHNRNAQDSIRRCAGPAARYLRERYAEKLGGKSGCNFAEAKTNIDWVMARDEPAYRTYLGYRARGNGPLQSVIEAQGHNPNAQESIRRCGSAAANYLATVYGAKLGAEPLRPDAQAKQNEEVDLNCLRIVGQAAEHAGAANVLSAARLHVASHCTVPVRGRFCIRFGSSARFSGLASLQPGAAAWVRVPDPRLEQERLADPRWSYLAHETCYRGKCLGSCD